MQRIKAIMASIYYQKTITAVLLNNDSLWTVLKQSWQVKVMFWEEQHYITGNTFSQNNDKFQLLVMSITKLRIDGCTVKICKSLFLEVVFLSDKLCGIGTDLCF